MGRTYVAELDKKGNVSKVVVGNYNPSAHYDASKGTVTAHQKLASKSGMDTQHAIGGSIKHGRVEHRSESVNNATFGEWSRTRYNIVDTEWSVSGQYFLALCRSVNRLSRQLRIS